MIVGAGPAGLFAAYELTGTGLKALVVDAGKDIDKRHCPMSSVLSCEHCTPCSILCGVGGAGAYSDGTLNLRPDIGGNLADLTGDDESAWELVEYVDSIYLKYGVPQESYIASGDDADMLKRRAASAGARFIDIKQRHIGSDHSAALISRMKDELESRGISFLLESKVKDILVDDGGCKGVLLENRKINSRYTILAPGRVGYEWMDGLVNRHSIKYSYSGVDIGVRVEVPSIIMDPVTRINHDPKFHIYTRRYDDFVRTFCTNEHGFVVKEEYEGFVATNGHSMHSKESENTNFAFLVHVELTRPMENTIKYARSVAKLATTIGGGKPVLQRLGDLRRGRRSTAEHISRNAVINTLKDVTSGDISMAMPHRIVMDIIEGLEVLSKIIPGVDSDCTLLYAPEVKFYSLKIDVDRTMQTNIHDLFVAGDGAGLSRDLINSSATGVLAARGIISRVKND
ncbi:NAD(P)/FAD-dependent oxidoreductase [uncultured Methanolobus sp.]|uniref:NAD(P)/FAD-dependent oxidoreductase n=1 Tax=uncultured Methanolobus sp. TaxID=218300 RepID=UPI0029C68FE8|nr:NAD(P)/FAD-dependent oxidoreductase [uncultured Methanolobus sp.]